MAMRFFSGKTFLHLRHYLSLGVNIDRTPHPLCMNDRPLSEEITLFITFFLQTGSKNDVLLY